MLLWFGDVTTEAEGGKMSRKDEAANGVFIVDLNANRYNCVGITRQGSQDDINKFKNNLLKIYLFLKEIFRILQLEDYF